LFITVSEAPSYHSTATIPEPVPPYTPQRPPVYSPTTIEAAPAGRLSLERANGGRANLLPSQPRYDPDSAAPDLANWQPILWPAMRHSNPNTRLYMNIAQRRLTSRHDNLCSPPMTLSSGRVCSPSSSLLPSAPRELSLASVSESREEDDSSADTVVRPLEDSVLVGYEAATRARHAREAKERLNELLLQEQSQWDSFTCMFDVSRHGKRAMRVCMDRFLLTLFLFPDSCSPSACFECTRKKNHWLSPRRSRKYQPVATKICRY